jgi:hypothetical protein
MNKVAQLYRNVSLPMVKIAIMRRGDRLKPPKYVIANFRTSLSDFKRSLKHIFYVLQDPNLNSSRDL